MEDEQHVAVPATGMESEIQPPVARRTKFFIILSLIVLLFLGSWGLLRYLTASPTGEAQVVIVDIPRGGTVRSISNFLKENGVIRSPEAFRALVRMRDIETKLPSGIFQFTMPMDVFSVVDQIAVQYRGIAEVKITIPEGSTLKQMSAIFSKSLPQFIDRDFLRDTNSLEGYLFPDTYFFYANATSGPVIETLRSNFNTKTKILHDETNEMKKNWGEIITMASIIEEEAVTEEDRHIISGILWKRIEKGMRLQVDAPFVYLLGKGSSVLTVDDLAYDSPFNTYRYAGLPPAPISNPGVAAIDAALHPTKSDYLYYLSDKDGLMHYARTFEEHKLNKAKYLR